MQRSVEGLRVTPWADWSEWLELKVMLANDKVHEANERIQCYLVRRRHAVPVAMVTTVSLRYQLKYPSPDEYSQRLSLAMAVVRFVNGMTDRLQPRGEGAFAKSVHSLAVELKLPLILVEIRHQASHNSLPPLKALESGARQALEWLDEYYWNAQHQKIQNSLDNCPRGLRHIFRTGDESEASLSDTALCESASDSDGAVCGRANEEDGSVLWELKTLSRDIVQMAKKRKDAERAESERLRRTGEQWIECDNREAWKATPIGLIPGQNRAPRWPVRFARGGDAQTIDGDLGSEENSLTESSLSVSERANASRNPTSEPPWKCLKQLTAEDAAKISEISSYYEKLLSAPSDL